MEEIADEVWIRCRRGDAEAQTEIVEHYLPLVKITVGRMSMNWPASIDQEDLYSAGCMGLLSAVERYDRDSEAKFSTYAITRVRGAVIDELRRHDALGRVTRDRVSRIREAEHSLRGEEGLVDYTAEEIAEEAGISVDEYYDALLGDRASRLVSLSEPVDDGESTLAEMLVAKNFAPDGISELEDEEILERIHEMLDEREKMIVVLYYEEELTLKEIGELMGVSESRVSQLHHEMIERIRRELRRMGVQ